ncbi:hypothetical protein P7C73_g5921, partial [Tremellales sp. Uapishka_1]
MDRSGVRIQVSTVIPCFADNDAKAAKIAGAIFASGRKMKQRSELAVRFAIPDSDPEECCGATSSVILVSQDDDMVQISQEFRLRQLARSYVDVFEARLYALERYKRHVQVGHLIDADLELADSMDAEESVRELHRERRQNERQTVDQRAEVRRMTRELRRCIRDSLDDQDREMREYQRQSTRGAKFREVLLRIEANLEHEDGEVSTP